MKRYTFQTTIDWACCINTLVEVEGTREDGVTGVYALGEHGGADIQESLSEMTRDRLYEELMAFIAEEAGEKAERQYEAMRDEEQANLHDSTWVYLNLK